MKEQPILFKGPMVRSILAGSKTQTRRIVKPEPPESWMPEVGKYHPAVVDPRTGDIWPDLETFGATDEDFCVECKYGQPGDFLWVKETFQMTPRGIPFYKADFADIDMSNVQIMGGWKPSIFMHRRFSRITLKITGIRAERLQDISEGDACWEGIEIPEDHDYIAAYRRLWESINGAGSWEANPWVWVLEFERITP